MRTFRDLVEATTKRNASMVPTAVPKSHLNIAQANRRLGAHLHGEYAGHKIGPTYASPRFPPTKSEVVDVPHDKLRATQKSVDSRGSLAATRGGDHDHMPLGLRTPDGNVHLIEGHHRAHALVKSGGGTMKVKVFHHSDEHEKAFVESHMRFAPGRKKSWY